MSAEVCGGCHNGFHHPTYDEWKTSPHARPTPDVATRFCSKASRECSPVAPVIQAPCANRSWKDWNIRALHCPAASTPPFSR